MPTNLPIEEIIRRFAEKEKEFKKAGTIRQQAEAYLSAYSTVGTRLAAAWSAAQGWWTQEREKTAKAIQEASDAVRAPLEVELSTSRRLLQEERQKTKTLKDSLIATAAELKEVRTELRRLQPTPDSPSPRPGQYLQP